MPALRRALLAIAILLPAMAWGQPPPDPAARTASMGDFIASFDATHPGSSPLIVGHAGAAVKILPRDMPFHVQAGPRATLSLARGETESLQVVVTPRDRDLRGVSVKASPLTSDTGAVFPRDRIDCDVVGYVKTAQAPPYAVTYVGWWPDPILSHLRAVDVAVGDLQAFWVRLRCPRDQAPGVYRGRLTVTAAGVSPVALDLRVLVRGFSVPAHSPLPMAVTFRVPEVMDHFQRLMGGEAGLQQRKLQWADFLADYYLQYDSLYHETSPDFEVLEHIQREGRLVVYNLGYFGQDIDLNLARLLPVYEEAKRRGLLSHAYAYGFDEATDALFPKLEEVSRALKTAMPEVPLLTTSWEHSYGLYSPVKTMDIWSPLTPNYDRARADEARRLGRKVYWYIACIPQRPFANVQIECEAIESRLLMGAMTARYRPDGFLYFSLVLWNENQPITGGPFTDWNPVSWTTYHGDGMLIYAGPDGMPAPSIRLENLRDGLEDYAYVLMLEAAADRVAAESGRSAAREAWLTEARQAIAVPDRVVTSLTRYTHRPAVLQAWRDHIADLIERSGYDDLNPWPPDMGPWGLHPPQRAMHQAVETP